MSEQGDVFLWFLKAYMKSNRLTQVELAKRTSLGRDSWRAVLQGKVEPNARHMYAIWHLIVQPPWEKIGVNPKHPYWLPPKNTPSG